MGTGRRKIEIKKILDTQARMVCFSKRRKGLFKKAVQFHNLTGTHIAVLVFSSAGRPYVHGSPSFESTIDHFLRATTTAAAAAASTHDNTHQHQCPSTSTTTSITDDGATDMWMQLMDLIDVEVETCDGVEELTSMKSNLERLKQRVALHLTEQQEFVGSPSY